MTTTAPYAPPAGTGSGTRTALLVIGGVVTALGAGNLVAGGAVAAWSSDQRDDGFYTAGPETLTTDAYALVLPELDVSAAGPDAFYAQDLLGDLRIRTDGADVPLFVGIGPADDVAAWVDGMAYDELADVEVDPFEVTTTPVDGGAPDGDPADQDFWVASADGAGSQTLEWEVEDGDWSVVVMNGDGSQGVTADVSVGSTLPFVMPVAIVTIVVGLLLLAVGIVLLVVAARTPARRPVYESRAR